MYCVKFLDRLRGKFRNFLKKPRIRLRQGYGVTGYADATDGLWDGIRRRRTPYNYTCIGAPRFDFAQARLDRASPIRVIRAIRGHA
jgi:hypothetical protein